MIQKPISIRITNSDWASLKRGLLSDDGKENAAALLCGVADLTSHRRLLVRQILPVSMSEYRDRNEYHLEISPNFYNKVVSLAIREKLGVVIVHSHPSSTSADYSVSDDYGESRLLPVLQSLIPESDVASLLITPTEVIGRTVVEGRFVALESLTVIGRRVFSKSFTEWSDITSKGQEAFERQIRAFGTEGQQTISVLKAAVVGVGGTGSIVAEQLVRLGVRDLVLVDPDCIEQSNVSRVFGSFPRNIGSPKVRVVGKHLRKINGVRVVLLEDTAIRQSVINKLRDRDVVFCCVDNDRSRSIIGRFAHQYLVPMIDIGMRLDGRGGTVRRAAGRVSIVGPDLICLRCSGHVDPERIRAESLPRSERLSLEREGYIMGIDEPAPAVVSLNTVVAGLGVTAALNLFVNLTGGEQPLNQLYDATEGIVFAVRDKHEPGCDICGDPEGVKALGDKQIVSAYD